MPPLAKAAKIGGKVKLQIVISPTGQVSMATFVSGAPVLQKAAIDAVKQWKFRPFLEGLTPIAIATDVELDFPSGMSESASSTRDR